MTQIFLDADGVLCDFDKRATVLLGMPPKEFERTDNEPNFWNIIYSDPDFFLNLDPMKDAQELVDGVGQLCDLYGLPAPIILTGKPRGDWAEPQKRAWKEKHFPYLEMICTASANKKDHMKSGDIIIDDWEKHQQKWIDAGGHWILHKSAKQSLQELQQLLEGTEVLRRY